MEQEFDFWQDHSDTFLTMAYLYDRRNTVEKPDGYGKKTGDCGDTITMFVTVDNGILKKVNFDLEGCINTNACSNGLAVLVEGKDVNQCWELTPQDVMDYLETLPTDHHHCAELAVGTFYLALSDYNKKEK